MAKLFGYVPDPAGTKQIIEDRTTAVREWTTLDDMAMGVSSVGIEGDKPPIVLLDAVVAMLPSWKRGAQAIGDCVSWGWELAVTSQIAAEIIYLKKPWRFPGEVATEPIYGGSRVEARGKRPGQGGWSDGSYGAAAAKWVTQWGALYRQAYNVTTGVEEHDLRRYSGEKAKQWGNWGCGGKTKDEVLDEIAKDHPIREAPKVTSFEQYVKCIESGYPVAICSMQGLSKRGSDGFASPRGTWAHCMLGGGVIYGRRPGGLIVNSWGNSWGTADMPGVDNMEIRKCSAWVDASVIDRMLKQNDSFAVTGVGGLIPRKIDWEQVWHISGRK